MPKSSSRSVRVFFATDVHGSNLCFRKFLSAPHYYEANILILGGDVTGKSMIPIVQGSSGEYTVEFTGRKRSLANEEELKSVEQTIANSGAYSFRTTVSELDKLNSSQDELNNLFRRLITERLREWIRAAEELKKKFDFDIYMTGGNDDEFYVDGILRESQQILNPEGQVAVIDGLHKMISCAYSNETPWKCPRDISEDELNKKIAEMTSNIKEFDNVIFNFHAPPKDSGLDTCPKLDTSTFPPKPIVERGEVVMYGAGSVSVRSAIERCQPLVGLHGHIHESRGVSKIARTLCFNPGSEYAEGVLRGVILNLEDKKVRSYQFTSG